MSVSVGLCLCVFVSDYVFVSLFVCLLMPSSFPILQSVLTTSRWGLSALIFYLFGFLHQFLRIDICKFSVCDDYDCCLFSASVIFMIWSFKRHKITNCITVMKFLISVFCIQFIYCLSNSEFFSDQTWNSTLVSRREIRISVVFLNTVWFPSPV